MLMYYFNVRVMNKEILYVKKANKLRKPLEKRKNRRLTMVI